MSHANAALAPVQRLRIARLIVDEGWPVAHAALFFHVSWPTVKRWADRYAAMGRDGVQDRSSRPFRSPNRTSQELVRKIVHLRWKKLLGPVAIGTKVGMLASTVHAILVRCRLNRLHHVDVKTGYPVCRYEHDKPGAMIHVDVKKLGKIPDGGGWRLVGRQQGNKNIAATAGRPMGSKRRQAISASFVHTVIDDHSRVAYAELNIRPKKIRPYRPQTNGKIERFHRTLADGWAFSRYCNSESARQAALPAWLHEYNHHRPHTAIGAKPPISRLTNLPGQYN